MAWSSPATRSTGELITAAIWNQDVVDNEQYLHDNLYTTNIYDSGWFAVTYGTQYTKAHGLGVKPRFVFVYWGASASPSTMYRPGTIHQSSSQQREVTLGANGTNIIVKTGSYSAYSTIFDPINASAGGYYRVIAIA